MKRQFPFLKDFRKIRGVDGCFNLIDDGLPLDLPDEAGVYIIETVDKFVFSYPKGKSSVIYIGKSDHLRQRLREHRTELRNLIETSGDYGMAKDQPWVCSRYQYMYYHGKNAKVYYYKCLKKQEAKELEATIMWAFYRKYRALPVGNGAKSYAKE